MITRRLARNQMPNARNRLNTQMGDPYDNLKQNESSVDQNTIEISSTTTQLANKLGSEAYNSKREEDHARTAIADFFVKAYVYLLAITITFSIAFNLLIFYLTSSADLFIPIKDITLLISSTVGTSLGFIIGYYFKLERN